MIKSWHLRFLYFRDLLQNCDKLLWLLFVVLLSIMGRCQLHDFHIFKNPFHYLLSCKVVSVQCEREEQVSL